MLDENTTTVSESEDEMSNGTDPQTEMVTTAESDEISETKEPQTQKSSEDIQKELDRVRAALKKSNNDAAKDRLALKELKTLKEFKEQVESEKLSAQEKQDLARQKLEQQLAEKQQQLDNILKQAQEDKINSQVLLHASKLGFADPDDAATYIAQHRSDVDVDENGSPTNINDLLVGALKSKPHWKAPSKPAPTSGGATNPSRSQSNAGGQLSWEVIGKMTTNEYNARRSEITQWMAAHPIR